MLRVLHVIDKLTMSGVSIHGLTRLIGYWIDTIDKNKFEIMVCSIKAKDPGGEYLEAKGIKTIYLSRDRFDLRILTDLSKIIKKENIDVLHLHGYAASNFGRLATLSKNVKCILHEHMDYVDRLPIYQRVSDFLLSPLNYRAFAVSESVKRFMVNHRSFKSNKVQVLYNGIPFNNFNVQNDNAIKDRPAFRELHNIPDDIVLVGLVGRLDYLKGHTFLIQAAKIVQEKNKKVAYVIAGDGPILEELKQFAVNNGVADKFYFLGFLSDVSPIFHAIDINVIASLAEGLSLTMLEAMAYKCAIIATDVGGTSEVIQNNKNGLLIPPKDCEQLAEKILFLAEHQEIRQKLLSQAFEDVKKYNLFSAVRQLEDMYRSICVRPERGK